MISKTKKKPLTRKRKIAPRKKVAETFMTKKKGSLLSPVNPLYAGDDYFKDYPELKPANDNKRFRVVK